MIAPAWVLVVTIVFHSHIHETFSPAKYLNQKDCAEDLAKMQKWPVKSGVTAYFLCRHITLDDFEED